MEEVKPVEKVKQTNHPTKSRHWLLLLIIILLVTIIASTGTYYYLSQKGTILTPLPQAQVQTKPTSTTDVTSNWKTYTSKSNEFGFKYPPQWYYQPFSEVQNGSAINFFLEGIKPDESFGDHFGNEILRISYDIGEGIYTFDYIRNNFYPNAKDITVAGKRAFQTPSSIGVLMGPSEKRSLIITTSKESKPYLTQILSTFKFIDQNINDTDLYFLKNIQNWTNKEIQWQDEKQRSKTYEFIKDGISGYSRIGLIRINNADDIGKYINEYVSDEKLKSMNWQQNLRLDAYGPGGGIYGYIKTTNNMSRILEFYYEAKPLVYAPQGGVMYKCPCTIEYGIFLSDYFENDRINESY